MTNQIQPNSPGVYRPVVSSTALCGGDRARRFARNLLAERRFCAPGGYSHEWRTRAARTYLRWSLAERYRKRIEGMDT